MRLIKNAVIRALKKTFFVLLILIFSLGILPYVDASGVRAQSVPAKTTIKGVYDYVHKDFADGTASEMPYLYNKTTGTAIQLVNSGQKTMLVMRFLLQGIWLGMF